MLRDHKLNFSDSQVMTSGATTNITSSSVLDMGPLATNNLYRNLATSDLYVMLRVESLPTSTGSATLSVKLVGDNNTGMTSTALIVQINSLVAVASLTKGLAYKIPIPRVNMERYLQLEYNIATAPFSAGGNITAFLTDRPDDYYGYAQNPNEDNSF